MIAIHRAIRPDTHTAPSGIMARVGTTCAALGTTGSCMMTLKRASVSAVRTAVIGIVAGSRTLIVTNRST